MLWIISGLTSSGKSSFIESWRCEEITGISSEAHTIFPASQPDPDQTDTYSGALYHYNILNSLVIGNRNPQSGAGTNFSLDTRWNAVNRVRTEKRAVVIVSSRERILERMKHRKQVETLQVEGMDNRYPAKYLSKIVERIDFADLYLRWCEELLIRGIPYVLVNGSGGSYPVIKNETNIPGVVKGERPMYTKGQVRKILSTRDFEYHRVELPYGLHTQGTDRSATRDIVFPEALHGESVLDVGCALGYFCFEAENMGASMVTGIEFSEKRFKSALLLKDIKGSKINLLKRDIVTEPLSEQFDHVLLLNVVHHLKEPFRVIKELASLTKKRMIIEFPTLSDRKFRKVSNVRLSFMLNKMPLVGVSSLKSADQTFVFSPAAMKRYLLEHEKLFKKVDIVKSPIPKRAIALCYK